MSSFVGSTSASQPPARLALIGWAKQAGVQLSEANPQQIQEGVQKLRAKGFRTNDILQTIKTEAPQALEYYARYFSSQSPESTARAMEKPSGLSNSQSTSSFGKDKGGDVPTMYTKTMHDAESLRGLSNSSARDETSKVPRALPPIGDIAAWSKIDAKTFNQLRQPLRRFEVLNLYQDATKFYSGRGEEMPRPLGRWVSKVADFLAEGQYELDSFLKTNRYARAVSFHPHPIFKHPCLSLYPIEKDSAILGSKSQRKTAHRPTLDVEYIDGKLYARAYLALYRRGAEKGHKDIVTDKSGEIHLQNIALMNLGNPMKALLWCEDYLKNSEHDGDTAPAPVIRSFLVPLADASWMLDDSSQQARPLDQDRGAGQFGSPGSVSFYAEKLHPLRNSLVSFVLDPLEYKRGATQDGRLVPMPVLQEYLTGQFGDPRDMTVDGVAAQHERKGHLATPAEGYEEALTAYFESVSAANTLFTDATQNASSTKLRASRHAKTREDLSDFPTLREFSSRRRMVRSSEKGGTSVQRRGYSKPESSSRRVAQTVSDSSGVTLHLNDTAADGNCFYHALFEGLTGRRSGVSTQQLVRKLVVERTTNRVAKAHWGGKETPAFTQWAAGQLTTGNWVDDTGPAAIADILRVRIVIHNEDGGIRYDARPNLQLVAEDVADTPVPEVHLQYTGAHYNSFTLSPL